MHQRIISAKLCLPWTLEERERERERERHAHRWLPNFSFSLQQGGRILRVLDLYRDSEEAARILGVSC